MRRREKFVLASITLSLGLFGVQYVSLDYRFWAVALLTIASYFISAWALFDDLQLHEWLSVVPAPAFYTAAISMFYYLLPENILSRVVITILFGAGIYARLLTANIFSVAKGKTIQLIHAAYAIDLLFTLFTSLLLVNSIFSIKLPFYVNFLLVFVIHLPLVLMSLWSVRLDSYLSREVWGLSFMLSLVLGELSLIFSFTPLSVWNIALLVMAVLYVGLGVSHNYLRGRLFSSTLTEYSLVTFFILIFFFLVLPVK